MAQRRGWLLLQDLVLPQCFYMPITQAVKEPSLGPAPSKKRCRERAQLQASVAEEKVHETQLDPHTAEGKVQGAGS